MPAFGAIAPRCGLRRSATSTSNERRNASHLRKPHNAAARSIHHGDDKDSSVPSVLGGIIPRTSSLAFGLANAEDPGRRLDQELRQQKQLTATSALSETSTPGVAQARRLASFSRPPDSASPGHRRGAAIIAAPWREPMSVIPVFGSSGEGSTLRGETTPNPALSCSASAATATALANAINSTATVPAAAGSGSGGAIVATAVRGVEIGGRMQNDNIVSGDGGDAGGWGPSLLEDEQLSPRKEDYGREEDGGGRDVPREDCPTAIRSDGGASIRPSSGRHEDAHNGCWEDTDYNSNSTWATNDSASFATRVSTGSLATMDNHARGGGGSGGGSPRSRVLAAALGAAAASEEGVLGGECHVVLRCAETGADLASRVHDFLASDRKVFLLSGEAGSGKSFFVTLLAHELALACSLNLGRGRAEAAGAEGGATTGGFLPIVIDAREAEGEHGMPLDCMVKHYLMSQLRMTKREISTIRKSQRLLVIVDGFDRISADKLFLVEVCWWQTQGRRFTNFSHSSETFGQATAGRGGG
ncbi:unnamed protein product [Ectocarpus sp. 6 AP-2014]